MSELGGVKCRKAGLYCAPLIMPIMSQKSGWHPEKICGDDACLFVIVWPGDMLTSNIWPTVWVIRCSYTLMAMETETYIGGILILSLSRA